MKKRYIIGIDIGGTNVRIGAVDQDLQIKALDKVQEKDVFSGENTIPELIRFIEAFISKYELDGSVEAISAGFPATINQKRTGVIQAPNVRGMNDMEVAAPLKAHFGVPVFVNRDVCMALYYDTRKYQIPEEGITIACYIGTGIGNVISINGEHVIGKDGTSGELGHIPVVGNLESCGCGNYGCIDNVAAGVYLARLQRETYPDTPIEALFTRLREEPLLREAVNNMAIAIATEINILNPHYIVLGGGVLAMQDFPTDYLEERIHFYTRKPLPEQTLEIIYATDDIEKGAVGAVLYARKMMEQTNYRLGI